MGSVGCSTGRHSVSDERGGSECDASESCGKEVAGPRDENCVGQGAAAGALFSRVMSLSVRLTLTTHVPVCAVTRPCGAAHRDADVKMIHDSGSGGQFPVFTRHPQASAGAAPARLQ